MQKKQVAYS